MCVASCLSVFQLHTPMEGERFSLGALTLRWALLHEAGCWAPLAFRGSWLQGGTRKSLIFICREKYEKETLVKWPSLLPSRSRVRLPEVWECEKTFQVRSDVWVPAAHQPWAQVPQLCRKDGTGALASPHGVLSTSHSNARERQHDAWGPASAPEC